MDLGPAAGSARGERPQYGWVVASDRDELREVSAAVLAVTSRHSVREVLATIVASARRLLGARYAALGVPDDVGRRSPSSSPTGSATRSGRRSGRCRASTACSALMLCRPDPVRMDDIRTHPQFGGWWPPAHPVLTDFLGMPIMHGDEILGELFLANKTEPGGFTADDEELLRVLAAHAAIALVNARLYERSRELSIVEERHRIARELHDSVTQKLFSLRLTAEAAAALVEQDPDAAAKQLDTVRGLAAEATEELRAIMVGLRPADLAGDGLATALRKQAELLDRVHTATVRFADRRSTKGVLLGPAGGGRLPHRAGGAAQRAAPQRRPAHPGRAGLRRRTLLRLTVSDDGRGFDPDAMAESRARRRLGLASMRERAACGRRPAGGRVPAGRRHHRTAGAAHRWLSRPIRVLVVDDHPVVRQGLRTFLDVQADLTVVGEAADGEAVRGRGRAGAPRRHAARPAHARRRRPGRAARAAGAGQPGQGSGHHQLHRAVRGPAGGPGRRGRATCTRTSTRRRWPPRSGRCTPGTCCCTPRWPNCSPASDRPPRRPPG